jgi:antitoxin HicB
MGATYTVSDGRLMLVLETAEEGGYIVTSPLDPQLITQAETLEEAFLMAYDARELLIQGRAELARQMLGRHAVLNPAETVNPDPPSPPPIESAESPDPLVEDHGSEEQEPPVRRRGRPHVLGRPGTPPPETS